MHLGLSRGAVGLAGITGNTGGNDVIPFGDSAMIARDDVVEIELTFRKTFPTILAGVFVAEEDVLAGKFHFLARDAIVEREDDDFGNLKRDADRIDHFFSDGILGVFKPRTDIVSLVTCFALGLHDLGVAEAE